MGKKTGAKYRTYMILNRYYEMYRDSLFENTMLKKAIDYHVSYIKAETLADEIEFIRKPDSDSFAEWMINDVKCIIKVKKI